MPQKFIFTHEYGSIRKHVITARLSSQEKFLLDHIRKSVSYSDLLIMLAKHSLSPLTEAHKKFLKSFPDKNFDLLYKQSLRGN